MNLNLKKKQFVDSFVGIPLIYIHLVFTILLGKILRRNHSIAHQSPSHLFFIKMLGFGSVILASDAIMAVKEKYPNAQLHIICSENIAEGVRALKLFDSVLVINDATFGSMLRTSFSTLFAIWQKPKRWMIDLEVYSKLTSLFSLWTMSVNRFGFYFNDVSFRYNLNTHNVYFNNVVNVEENYKRMAEELGGVVDKTFTLPGYQPRQSDAVFDYISINNTCSELSPERKLPADKLQFICTWLLEHTSYKIALMGTKSDFALHEEFINTYFPAQKERIENACGKFSLPDYFDFLYTKTKALITIDSAPLHIANKLNVPNLSIWGPTTPESRINDSALHKSIFLGVSCSPCAHQTDVLPCGGDNICMKQISNSVIAECLVQML